MSASGYPTMPVWNTARDGDGGDGWGDSPAPRQPRPGRSQPRIPHPTPRTAQRFPGPSSPSRFLPSPPPVSGHPTTSRPGPPDALTDFPRGGGPDGPEGAAGQHRPVLQHQPGHGVATCAPTTPRRRPSGVRAAGLRRRREDPGRGRARTAPGEGQRHLEHRERGLRGGIPGGRKASRHGTAAGARGMTGDAGQESTGDRADSGTGRSGI